MGTVCTSSFAGATTTASRMEALHNTQVGDRNVGKVCATLLSVGIHKAGTEASMAAKGRSNIGQWGQGLA